MRTAAMRLALLALLAAVPALAPAQGGDEAKKLFEAMEERLTKAKSVSLGFSIEASAEGKQRAKLKGSLTFAEGDRMRLEMEGNVAGRDHKSLLVSDGKRLRMIQKGRPAMEVPTSKSLSGVFALVLSRSQLCTGLEILADLLDSEKEQELKPADLFRVSDLKLGGKEKVGERETRVLSYKVASPGERTFDVTAWVDPLTHLPLKRVVIGMEGPTKKIHLVEHYTGIKTGAKLDPKQFELPK